MSRSWVKWNSANLFLKVLSPVNKRRHNADTEDALGPLTKNASQRGSTKLMESPPLLPAKSIQKVWKQTVNKGESCSLLWRILAASTSTPSGNGTSSLRLHGPWDGVAAALEMSSTIMETAETMGLGSSLALLVVTLKNGWKLLVPTHQKSNLLANKNQQLKT